VGSRGRPERRTKSPSCLDREGLSAPPSGPCGPPSPPGACQGTWCRIHSAPREVIIALNRLQGTVSRSGPHGVVGFKPVVVRLRIAYRISNETDAAVGLPDLDPVCQRTKDWTGSPGPAILAPQPPGPDRGWHDRPRPMCQAAGPAGGEPLAPRLPGAKGHRSIELPQTGAAGGTPAEPPRPAGGDGQSTAAVPSAGPTSRFPGLGW